MEKGDLITTSAEIRKAFEQLRNLGVTQEHLANDLGRSTVALWYWANDVHPVPKYAAQHLRSAYGITKQSLMRVAA
jgi:hypothetical protein